MSLTERSLAAAKWNYIGVLVRIFSQIVVQIVLARLLGPDTLGLFALAFVMVGIGIVVVEMGLGSALVQKKNLDVADERFVFTRVVIAALAMGFFVYLLANDIGRFFDDPRVTGVVKALTPVFILQALSVVPQALLKRELAFKTIQLAQISSYLVGFLLVGTTLAFLGAGVWSLVAAWVAQTLTAAVIFNISKRTSMRPAFRSDSSALGSFGVRVLSTNLSNWAIENLDNLLVGKFFGSIALGLYSVSYNLVRTPMNHLVMALQAVLFPVSARAQNSHGNLRRAYLTVVSGVAVIAFPLFSGVAAVADTIVKVLFGAGWVNAVPILVPLALAMIFHAPMAVAGPVLWGKGAAGSEFKVQFFVALALILTLLIAGQYSVVAMAWAVFSVYLVRLLWMTATLMRHIQLPVGQLLRALTGAVVATIFVLVVLFTVEYASSEGAAWKKLALEFISAGSVLALLVIFVPAWILSDELLWVSQRLVNGVPTLAKSPLMRRLLSARAASGQAD